MIGRHRDIKHKNFPLCYKRTSLRNLSHIKIKISGVQKQTFTYIALIYKTKPTDQTMAPAACEWRLSNKQLSIRCTAKGRKKREKQYHTIEE